VLRAINPRHNPTQDTLNRLLRPFKLRLTLAPLEPSKGRRAAGFGGFGCAPITRQPGDSR